ncbi:X-Pro dipeptidyl-peptidase (S15 family) [Synechococcus sp. PCC 7335]|uniref:alpha/beta hydrolase n=1 Tax=Synechococcus sp. (strain ATCC 29403 / PCC 7335) TaxID=91464 RepID=UPI00017EC48B|nr:alpha/beta fold hydrolase [Synechococcus sp. PCC 7335]EDX82390.1 X-Pro dipeptidyl-peptidase (S15 family) [Synechococcus sp. PCC 7335]
MSTETVTFEVDGVELVGDLHMPENTSAPVPAVAIIGPMTFERNQAPTRYAQALSQAGYAALAFDARYRGDSGGMPRQLENPFDKLEDMKAAVDFLRSRDDVDSDRVNILGICQGGSVALRAAQEHPNVHAVATITSQYRDLEGDKNWLGENYQHRVERGTEALKKYKETGEVDYVKAVDQTDMEVGMPGEFVWKWYQPWADRNEWANQYPVMSDKMLLDYSSIESAQKMDKPWLIIHGDNCFLPNAAKRHFEAIPEGVPKRLIWDDTPHLSYYDQDEPIRRASKEVSSWFKRSE